MEGRQILFFILFQVMINLAVLLVEGTSRSSRSAYFITRENKRLNDHVVKRFTPASLMCCGLSCLKTSWCTSVNFEISSENGKGTCELNSYEISITGATAKLHDQQGVIFSMILKVI